MRVGISGYVGNRLTGIGRVLICTLQELAKQNPDSTYVIFRNFDFSDYDSLRSFSNIEIVDVPCTKESGLKNILWHQWTFQKLLKRYKLNKSRSGITGRKGTTILFFLFGHSARHVGS